MARTRVRSRTWRLRRHIVAAGSAGGFVCTLLFGYLVKISGDYNLPLLIIAAMVALAALVFWQIDPTQSVEEPAADLAR